MTRSTLLPPVHSRLSGVVQAWQAKLNLDAAAEDGSLTTAVDPALYLKTARGLWKRSAGDSKPQERVS